MTAINSILNVFKQTVTVIKPTTTEYGAGFSKYEYTGEGTEVTIALQKKEREIVQDVEGQTHNIDAYATFDTTTDIDERDLITLTSGEKFIVFKKIIRNDNMNSNLLQHAKVDLEIYEE